MWNLYAANFERNADLELVRVPAVADPHLPSGVGFRTHSVQLLNASILSSRDPVTVYVNPIFDAYNSSMRKAIQITVSLLMVGVRLQASGGVPPYHWRVVNGTLPRGLKLEDDKITGIPDESGNFQFALEVRDSNNPPAEAQKRVVLTVETAFSAEWDRKAQVNGQRIDGSVKVSNRTGRNFDLTFIVLAVNEIGRATAIGYQHFPLKSNTRDLPLPFGDNLSPGNYTVNVDLVAEEPIGRRIFRTRLVTPKQTISQGP